jgi:tripartite-type tricarboxylate transporter receptor subunit TctC
MVLDTARTAQDRQALELFFARAAIGRPFVAPPGVPAERIAALRAAFDATLADPAFRDDAKKLNLNVVPITARETMAVVAKAYATPPEIVRRTRQALGRGN